MIRLVFLLCLLLASPARAEQVVAGLSRDSIGITASFLGMRVAAVSVITNMGAGLKPDEAISHEQTKAMAPVGAAKLEKILRRYLQSL